MRVLCNTLTLLKNLQEFLAMVLISDQSLYLSYVFTLSKVDTRNVAKVNMKWSSHMVVLIMKKKIENMQHWDNFFSFVSGGKGFYISFSYTL